MNDINLLLKLQELDNDIRELSEESDKTSGYEDLEKCKKKLKVCKDNRESILGLIDNKELEVKNINSKLKDEYFNLEYNEEKLYSGSISDIKKLESLSLERDKLKEKVAELENLYLVEVDKLDILRSELTANINNINKLEVEIKQQKENTDKILKTLDSNLNRLKEEKNHILKSLSEESLKTYKYLSSKKKFIVEVRDDRCLGCNMILPVYLLEKLNGDSIIQCENCDRVLYKIKN